MTTNRDDDLERRLEGWLADTARPMPAELFDDIVAAAPRVARAGVRAEFPSGGRWRLAIGALVAVVVVAIGVGVVGRLPLAPGASPSPPPGPSASETPAPSASPFTGEWHRNNYTAGEERLLCTEAPASWTCNYQVPDGSGWFSGQNATDSWACPTWFPSGICEDVVAVYHGAFVLLPPEGETSGPNSVISQDYVITDVDGQQVLQLYWVDQFVCPWYRTYEEALAKEFVCWFAP